MNLHVIGSNSLGNCYVLENGKEALVIECGMKLFEVKKVLKFKTRIIQGAIVSHAHEDHSGYIDEYLRAGIPVLALQHVFEAKKISMNAPAKAVTPGRGYILSSFKVIAFSLYHDVPCVGYLIEHEETGKVLFITDTFMCEYRFNGLNQIIIEANYADDILTSNIESGKIPASMRPRLINSHMELETCKNLLKSNDLSKVNNIVLCHLSDGNSDETRFVNEVVEKTGRQVFAAKKGLSINFDKISF